MLHYKYISNFNDNNFNINTEFRIKNYFELKKRSKSWFNYYSTVYDLISYDIFYYFIHYFYNFFISKIIIMNI